MTPYDWAIVAGLFVSAWLLALVLLRGHRPWLQATFAALALTFIINGAAYTGTVQGLLPTSWESTVLWSMILAHPLAAILVLSLLHGETLPRRRPVVFFLLAAVPVLFVLTPSADWALQSAYGPTPLGAFLLVCLGIALAEPIYQRETSRLFRTEAFWLIAGVIALIVGGPVYNYEFDTLGWAQAAGSNVLAPASAALFALALFRADPYPAKGAAPAGTHPPAKRQEGRAIVFEETRPKYLYRAAAQAAVEGSPVLVLGRTSPWALDGTAHAVLVPSERAALRSLATVAEFCARSPGRTVVVPDLADIATWSGWERTREMTVRARRVAVDTGARLLVSSSRLTDAERDSLRNPPRERWALPDPSNELAAVLGRAFGSGAEPLLNAFAKSRGIRVAALTVDQTSALVDFLRKAVGELSESVTDHAAADGLRAQVDAAIRDLQAFAARSPEDLAKGEWPSKEPRSEDRGLLVTASDYWKGKEMGELFAAGRELEPQEPLFERARSAFVEQLGAAGEGMFRSEVARLGKRPEELAPGDVARLADRAAVDLGAMADVVDVPQEKVRIQGQVEALRKRLQALAGDDA